VLALFVRSAVIGNNDFGYRVALLPQFFLLVLAADLLASWWIDGRRAVILQTPLRKKLVYCLIALGLAGTTYQVVMLRLFLPIEASHAETGFGELPAQVFQVREALVELERTASPSAVLEFNPVDPHPGGRGDVIAPYMFYARAVMMNAGRQILSAEPQCAVEFGGENGSCAAVETSTSRLFALPAPSAQWATGYCQQFGVDYLTVGEMDPVWDRAEGWAETLPTVVSEPGIRIVRCSGAASSH
jgi:hypothetical protein